jgi:hypothetical protein
MRSNVRSMVVLAGLLATVAACDKKDEKAKGDPAAATGAATTKSTAAAATTGAATAAATGATPATAAAATAAPANTAAPAADVKAGAAAPSGAVHAWSHLPADCDVAVSIDLHAVMGQADVARDVVPLLDGALKKTDVKDEGFKRFQTAMSELGLDLKKSLHSFAVCVRGVPKQPKFSVALAGDFKPETIVAVIEKNMKPEKKKAVTDIDGRKAISDDKFTFGQAADGTLVMSDDLGMFKAMNATGDSAKTKYALATDKALSFGVSEGLIKTMSADPKTPKEFQKLLRAGGFVDVASSKVGVKLGAADPTEAKKLEAFLIVMKGQGEKELAADKTGMIDALKAITTKVEGSDVVIEGAIPAAALSNGVKAMAGKIQEGLKGL